MGLDGTQKEVLLLQKNYDEDRTTTTMEKLCNRPPEAEEAAGDALSLSLVTETNYGWDSCILNT